MGGGMKGLYKILTEEGKKPGRGLLENRRTTSNYISIGSQESRRGSPQAQGDGSQ
jgi:hypothetical protein